MKTFAEFLKQEFNIPINTIGNDEVVKNFRVEKIKKKLSRDIKNDSKLKRAVEGVLVDSSSDIDIDDEIEGKWNESFHKIKTELLNIDEVLNTDRVTVTKTIRKIKKNKQKKTVELEMHLLDYSWFVKISAACVIVLLLAVSTTTFAPNFSNNLSSVVDSALKEGSQNFSPDKHIDSRSVRKATVSKEAMSRYIVENENELKDLRDGDTVDTGLGVVGRQGRVAGVSEKHDEAEENLFLSFLRKIIKID